MGYILISCIALEAYFAYVLSGNDILSPWFISCVMFGLVTLVAMLNLDKWGVTIEPFTSLLITCSLLFFGLGETIGREIINQIEIPRYNQLKFKRIILSKSVCVFCVLFGLIVCYYSYKNTLAIALVAGYTGRDTEYLLESARNIDLLSYVSHNIPLSIAGFAVVSLGYVFIFALFNNLFFYQRKNFIIKNIFYLLPVLTLIGVEILSTSRNGFIRLIQMSVFIFFMGWQMKNKRKYSFIKASLLGIVILYVFFVIFQMLGMLTGKTSRESAWDMFSGYSGAAVAALNESLKTVNIAEDGIGVQTFKGTRDLMERMGADMHTIQTHNDFTCFNNGYYTNIYTSLGIYYRDFGFIGTILIQFIMGAFFSIFYCVIMKREKFDLLALLYAYFAYALVIQIATADFLRAYFSVTHSFLFLFIFIGYWILIGRQKTIKIEMHFLK